MSTTKDNHIKGEHVNIRIATRLEDLEAAALQVQEDLGILRALIRTTHNDLRGQKCQPSVTEKTYGDLLPAA